MRGYLRTPRFVVHYFFSVSQNLTYFCYYQTEEMEEWSPSFLTGHIEKLQSVPGRIISCFNASAVLCTSLF